MLRPRPPGSRSSRPGTGRADRRIGVISLPAFYEDFAARRKGDPNYRSATRDVSRLLAELKKEQVDGIVDRSAQQRRRLAGRSGRP
jgi:C-terminal processing protease CtpA/Prc